MSAKQQAIQAIEKLPDNCTIEDIQQELYVTDLLRKRVEQADKGNFATQEETEKRLGRWLQK